MTEEKLKEYGEWKERCFQSFKRKLDTWNDLTEKTGGYACDLLDGAFMYDYFDDTVKEICNYILENVGKQYFSVRSLAKTMLEKHGK